jgi:tRNA 2-selenouridine synthase
MLKAWPISTSVWVASASAVVRAAGQALDEQLRSGDVSLHQGWIEGLLKEYYDPMYAYQRDAKAGRIEFAGDAREVREHLKARARRGQH